VPTASEYVNVVHDKVEAAIQGEPITRLPVISSS
jgi:hypothetical protein